MKTHMNELIAAVVAGVTETAFSQNIDAQRYGYIVIFIAKLYISFHNAGPPDERGA